MSSKSTTPVSAKFIRTAYANGEFTVPEGTNLASLVGKNGDGKVRGRLNPVAVQAFLDSPAGKGHTYGEKSVAEAKTIVLPLTKPNAKGARMKRPEAFPIAEVRALAGAPAKGRLSSAVIAAATRKAEVARGW